MPKNAIGRIYFAGNPWPKGHAIIEFEWSGRIERSTGVWFDFHLKSAFYDADDVDSSKDSNRESDKDLWNNYGECVLSSTAWPGEGFGFLAATKDAPLKMSAIPTRVYTFDEEPTDLTLPRPFPAYILGHEATANHIVRFRRATVKGQFNISWSGKVAYLSSCNEGFTDDFSAKLQGVSLRGIYVPNVSSTQDAFEVAEPYISNVRRDWKLLKDKQGMRLAPK